MRTAPLPIATPHRQLLADFERRYEGWWTANAAAEAAEHELAVRVREHEAGRGSPPEGVDVRRVLDLHAAAFRLQQEAMQLLRAEPI